MTLLFNLEMHEAIENSDACFPRQERNIQTLRLCALPSSSDTQMGGVQSAEREWRHQLHSIYPICPHTLRRCGTACAKEWRSVLKGWSVGQQYIHVRPGHGPLDVVQKTLSLRGVDLYGVNSKGRVEYVVPTRGEHMSDLIVTARHTQREVREIQHCSAQGGSEHPGVLSVCAHVQLQKRVRVRGTGPFQQSHHFVCVLRPTVASELTERGVEVDICIGWEELKDDGTQIRWGEKQHC